jgi:hypothetical protein
MTRGIAAFLHPRQPVGGEFSRGQARVGCQVQPNRDTGMRLAAFENTSMAAIRYHDPGTLGFLCRGTPRCCGSRHIFFPY